MLYERGLSDYQGIPAVGFHVNEGNRIWEGHVTEGNRIWEGYREFEQGILATIDKADIEVADAKKKALQMYSKRAYLEGHISKKDFFDTEKFQQFMVLATRVE